MLGVACPASGAPLDTTAVNRVFQVNLAQLCRAVVQRVLLLCRAMVQRALLLCRAVVQRTLLLCPVAQNGVSCHILGKPGSTVKAHTTSKRLSHQKNCRFWPISREGTRALPLSCPPVTYEGVRVHVPVWLQESSLLRAQLVRACCLGVE